MRAFCNICSDFHMKKTGMSIHILIIIESHVHNRKRKKKKTNRRWNWVCNVNLLILKFEHNYHILCVGLSRIIMIENFQGSTYLCGALLWKFTLVQPYFGWIRTKTYSPTNFQPTGKHASHSYWKQIYSLSSFWDPMSNSAIITVE